MTLTNPHEISLAHALTAVTLATGPAVTETGESPETGNAVSHSLATLIDLDKISLHDVLALEVSGRTDSDSPSTPAPPASSWSAAEAEIGLYDLHDISFRGIVAS